MYILNRIRYLTQRGKRQDLLNRYGFYETVETQRGKLIGDDMLGGVSILISNYTTFHLHTTVHCPFLIRPHDKEVSEYSCRLCLISARYKLSLEELIPLLEWVPFVPSEYESLMYNRYPCKCMKWTGHISQE